MSVMTGIAIYLTIWWTTLFAVLPLGTRSHHEMGIEAPGGGDPASPVNPNLKRKFITTTWVSAILFGIFLVVWHFGILKYVNIPTDR